MHKVETKVGQQDLIIETGRLAKQADGAVTIQYGGTVVLVTAVASKEPKEEVNFLPLTVEYREKTYAAGKIPGGFFKREGRPTEKEILTARLIDRPLRPLFPEGFVNEVQIMAMVLSSDGENDPDVLAMVGASAALGISDIPFPQFVGTVRVGRIGDEFIVNPTYAQLDESTLDLVISGTKEGIIMVESGSKELSEEIILEGINFGYTKLLDTISIQEKLVSACGKPKIEVSLRKIDEELYQRLKKSALSELKEVNKLSQKEQREEAMEAIGKRLAEEIITEDSPYAPDDVESALISVEKEEVRKFIIEQNKRIDGRSYSDIRTISCDVGVLPRTHGSGLFTRGQTQSLSVTTLGTSADEQMIEALEGETSKTFMLHYNFPPFSVGEVKPARGPGRREIGHGALAERALGPVMPSKDEFPYTVRVVSDVLESNGSSSMATVCAGSLSLMDAGVPIKSAVSGVAMGLVKEGDNVVILTDIGGLEDHFGDMDFKVAGTASGITAVQLDIKIKGITSEIVKSALEEARTARLSILEEMNVVISESRESLSMYAPRITTIQINPEKIRDVIGPGGKVIRKITADTGVKIDIEDDGKVLVASTSAEASQKAIEIIKSITQEAEVGKIYNAKVKRVTNFGAFCEIFAGTEGLVHVSELADHFVNKIEDVIKVGDEIKVKVIGIDELGRINLSKKQAEQQ